MIILCAKNYLLKIMEGISVGILQNRNFVWKVEDVKVYLVKHNSIFGMGYYNRKNNIFFFIFNMFSNKNLRKKALNNLTKSLFITSLQKPVQSQKNKIRAKAG